MSKPKFSPEAIEKMREAGRRGGQAKVPKGFALMSPEKRLEAWKKGGSAKGKKEDV